MVTVCCVCNKSKTNDGWINTNIEESETLSHGYCPHCANQVRKEINEYKRLHRLEATPV